MRIHVMLVVLAGTALLRVPAQAENRIFIIASNADGYGVDRCLANGETCGTPIATAYCKAQEFDRALSFRKVDRAEITGMVLTEAPVCRGACDDLVAIECGR